jgi:hypothetical protein
MLMPSLGLLWLQPLFLLQLATTANAFVGPGVGLRRPPPTRGRSTQQLFGEYEDYMDARRRAQEQQQQQQSSPQGQPPFPDLSAIKNQSPPQQQQQTNRPFESAGSNPPPTFPSSATSIPGASGSVKRNYSPGGGGSPMWKTNNAGSSSTPAPPTKPPITTTPRTPNQQQPPLSSVDATTADRWRNPASELRNVAAGAIGPPRVGTSSSWAENNNNNNMQSNAAMPPSSWSTNSNINRGDDNKYGNEPSWDPAGSTAGAVPVWNDNKSSLLGTTTAAATATSQDEESSLPWWKVGSDTAELSSSSLDPPTAAGQAPVLDMEKLRTVNPTTTASVKEPPADVSSSSSAWWKVGDLATKNVVETPPYESTPPSKRVESKKTTTSDEQEKPKKSPWWKAAVPTTPKKQVTRPPLTMQYSSSAATVSEHILKSCPSETQASGAGGASTWDAFQRVEENWRRLRMGLDEVPRHFVTNDAAVGTINPKCWDRLRQLNRRAEPLDYDILVCGGTLGIFFATALTMKGHRVGVLEAGKLRGRAQEWNISQKELDELIEMGVLSQDDVEAAIQTDFPACRSGFKVRLYCCCTDRGKQRISRSASF